MACCWLTPVRMLMHEAAATRGLDPQRLSFAATPKILRCRPPERPASPRHRRRYHRLAQEIAGETLEPRCNWVTPRAIKCKMRKWPQKRSLHRLAPQPTKQFEQAIIICH